MMVSSLQHTTGSISGAEEAVNSRRTDSTMTKTKRGKDQQRSIKQYIEN